MPRKILFLLTYVLSGSLPLIVARGLRQRGYDVMVAFYVNEPAGYTQDPAEDFRSSGSLLDLSRVPKRDYRQVIEAAIDDNDVGLVVQIGCEPLYRHLPYIRERRPHLRMVDVLYNDIGHVVSHFLFERCLDGVVVENEYMRRFVQRGSAKVGPTVHLLESGIDLETFRPLPASPAGSAFRIGYVGRMSAEKNPLGFVEMAEGLAALQPDLEFKMFGQGPLGDEVRRRVETSSLGERIRFVGYVADVQDGFREIDVLVVPSFVDGRPNIIMEANACGIPVIGAPVGGIPELVVDGRNGLVCSPKEVGTMSRVIAEWRANPSRWHSARASARQTADTLFSRDSMLDRWSALASSYLEQHGSEPLVGSVGIRAA